MYRKGVSAFILNQHNELLLVNLINFEEKYFAIPGGGVEDGENLEDAVYREIQEELGINKDSLELIGKGNTPLQFSFTVPKIKEGVEYVGSERHFFCFKFTGGDSQIKLQEEEVRMFKWVSSEDLGKYLLFDNQYDDTVQKLKEILPRGVIFIITRNKKALLQLRDNNSRRCKNMWCFPGGGSDEDETYEETLKREVFEEYNITIDPKDCELLMTRHVGGTNHVFICPISDDQEPVMNEGADMKWVDIEEIKSLRLGFEQDDVVERWEGWLKKKNTTPHA